MSLTRFRFLHAADIHLDSPLHGLSRYEGLPVDELRSATRAAFDNLVQCAIDEDVDFVVIAGDLFDGDWRDMGTGLYFAKAMGRLDQAGRSEEHTTELQSLMRSSYVVLCLKTKLIYTYHTQSTQSIQHEHNL